MTAYSFKKRFVVPIWVGLGMEIQPWEGLVIAAGLPIRGKRQTIRATGRRRHARPGEFIQLYTAMRTKQCRFIAESMCESVHKIEMDISKHKLYIEIDGRAIKGGGIHDFARQDGFEHGEDMLEFWHTNHPGVKHFDGNLIKW